MEHLPCTLPAQCHARSTNSRYRKVQPAIARCLRAGFSGIAAPAIENRRHEEAGRQPRRSGRKFDSRTHMLLAKPIAPTILRLAMPNATVMLVQILIGLLEVYFVSRTGVDALAGVAPVFPLVSLVLAIAQGAIGGGIVTTVARALGTGRTDDAKRIRVVRCGPGRSAGPRDDRRHVCVGSKPVRLYGRFRKCLSRSPTPIRPPSLQAPR